MNRLGSKSRKKGTKIMAITAEQKKKLQEIIDQKKAKGQKKTALDRPDTQMGSTRKAFKNKKHGGVFDK